MSDFLKTAAATLLFIGLCDSARAMDLYAPSNDFSGQVSKIVMSDILPPLSKTKADVQPKKFGVARLDGGRLIALPFGEEEDWIYLDRRSHSTFEPISVTGYLKNVPEISFYSHDTSNKIDEIRLTAKDQNLDYVIVYDVDDNAKKQSLAEAKMIDIYSGKVLGRVTAEPDEIEFNIGTLADRVGEMVDLYTNQST